MRKLGFWFTALGGIGAIALFFVRRTAWYASEAAAYMSETAELIESTFWSCIIMAGIGLLLLLISLFRKPKAAAAADEAEPYEESAEVYAPYTEETYAPYAPEEAYAPYAPEEAYAPYAPEEAYAPYAPEEAYAEFVPEEDFASYFPAKPETKPEPPAPRAETFADETAVFRPKPVEVPLPRPAAKESAPAETKDDFRERLFALPTDDIPELSEEDTFTLPSEDVFSEPPAPSRTEPEAQSDAFHAPDGLEFDAPLSSGADSVREKNWTCSVCGCRNPDFSRICAVCGTSREGGSFW